MTFDKITILPNDKSTWRIHKGFEIIPGTNLGYFKWKYDGKTSTDKKLFEAISEANIYAEELNLIERIINPPQIKSSDSILAIFLSDRKNYSAWTSSVLIPWSKHYKIERWNKVNCDAANLLLSLDPSFKKSYWINNGMDFPNLAPSDRKNYEMSLLNYLEKLGFIEIDTFLRRVNLTDAGFHLHNTYSK